MRVAVDIVLEPVVGGRAEAVSSVEVAGVTPASPSVGSTAFASTDQPPAVETGQGGGKIFAVC